MAWSYLAEVSPIGRFLTYALTTPLGIPAILILVDQWRFSLRTVLRIGAGLSVFLGISFFVIYQTMGVTSTSVFIVAWVTPIVCWAAFIVCCKFRDGRLLFSIVTAFLLAFVTEALACMVTPRYSLLWVFCKIGFTLIEISLLYFLGRKPFLEMLHATDVGWFRMSLLPIALHFLHMNIYLLSIFRENYYPSPFPALLLYVVMLLIYVSLYTITKNATQTQALSRDIGILQTQMHFMEQQAKILQVNDHDNRTFRHDLRHYLGLLRGCAEAQNIQGIEDVIDRMEASFHQLRGHYSLKNYTGEPVLDAALSFFNQQAELAGISFSVQMVLPPTLRVDMVELAVVISNALENALNACLNAAEQTKEIRIQSDQRKDQFYLCIKNTCAGNIQFDPATGLPYNDQQGHGYGVSSIMAFANKYDIIVDFKNNDNWFCLGMLI